MTTIPEILTKTNYLEKVKCEKATSHIALSCQKTKTEKEVICNGKQRIVCAEGLYLPFQWLSN